MTLLEEVCQILSHSADVDQEMNNLADRFRSGKDTSEILLLIDSDDNRIVEQGLWLLNELPTDCYDTSHFKQRLCKLVDDSSPLLRWYSFGALFPLLDRKLQSTYELAVKITRDENEGVRMSGEAALKQIRELSS
jgi:hypothetical protein